MKKSAVNCHIFKAHYSHNEPFKNVAAAKNRASLATESSFVPRKELPDIALFFAVKR